MIGTRYVTTAALALGAILLATTALQGVYAQARGEGLPPGADSRIDPNLADTADSADSDGAEPGGRGQSGPFVAGSNPDGNRARFTGQPIPAIPYPDTASPPSKAGKQATPYAAQRYSGGSALPPTTANPPRPRAPYTGGPGPGTPPASRTPGGDPGTQGSAKNTPYKQGPYATQADYSGYQGGYQGNYGGYQGSYYSGYQGSYGDRHHADCP